MTTSIAFFKRHAVLLYYVLVFAISWGGILMVVAPTGFPGTPEQTETIFYPALLVMLVGPTIAGILLTGLVYGREGLRALLARLFRWRVGARWYAVALLATPLLLTATLLVLALTSPVFLPGIVTADDKAALLLMGIAVGLIGGFLEELGWTGFAVPELRRRHGILATGLIVGLLWGVWHFLLTFWASGDATGALSLSLLAPPLIFYVAVLPVYRVLMVWVYDRTESVLVAMLMHASLIASTFFLLAPLATGMALSAYYLILTVALWVVVAAVAVANHGHITRQPLGQQGA
jgi:membrane protease YdiL (CAAX protease family)